MKKIVKIIFIIIFTTIVIILLSTQIKINRYCGHTQSLFDKLRPKIYMTHCCFGGKLMTDLYGFYLAQQVYYSANKQYATTLTELIPYSELSNRSNRHYTLVLSGTTSNWQCAVSKTDNLPGYYLLESDGIVYFNKNHMPDKKDRILTR